MQQSRLRPSHSYVNKISMRHSSKPSFARPPQQSYECFRCGKLGHFGTDASCPARSTKCHRSDLFGHFSFKCKSKRSAQTDSNTRRKRYRGKVNFVDVDQALERYEEKSQKGLKELDCFKMDGIQMEHESTKKNGLIQCIVGGTTITMLIDSRSRVNIISGQDWDMLNQHRTSFWDCYTFWRL